MTEENRNEEQAKDQSSSSSSANDEQTRTGDPGRTPGAAEGERKTVEEDVREKHGAENP